MGELFDRYERALKAGGARGGSVRISGAGRVSGGIYESMSISGSATVEGDVWAERVRVSGSASFHGSVDAEEVSISGSAEVEGNLRGRVLEAAGSLSVAGVLECDEARVAGALRARVVRGKLVRLSGAFRIEEEINAPLVKLKLSNDSSCRFIKAEEVSIEPSEGYGYSISYLLFRKLARRRGLPALEVDLLESRLVRARDVIIEGRVKAERVELHGEAEVRGTIEGEVIRL